MCGILGAINIDFTQETLDLLSHRGPDDSGIESFDVAGQKIKFGHRRLSIQDLSPAGHQPMFSHNKNFVIIFNGEVYNHFDLREKNTNKTYRGTSDTETIVDYIAEFGIGRVGDLNGIFGFSILDIENEKLYIVRDKYGVKPLYYLQKDNQIVFSSEIKTIQNLFELSFSKQKIAEFLKSRFNPAPDTIYNEVNKVRPGHYLEVDLKSLKINEVSYQTPIVKCNDISFDDAVIKYEEYFERAVKRQMLADVEVGVFLSGGIDSALVTYYAQKHSNYKMKSFTVGFQDEDDSNELDDARESSEILGTEHFESIISASDFEKSLFKSIKAVEEPLGTTSIIPIDFLSELAAKHVKVILTGQGADEPLGGYTRYKTEWLVSEYPFLPYLFSPFSFLSKFIKNETVSRGLYSLGTPNIIERFDKTSTLFSNAEIKKITGETENLMTKRYQYFYDNLKLKNLPPVEARMALDGRMDLGDDLLLYTDKISMLHTIETRVPILDYELMNFIESLPYRHRLDFKSGKKVHKAMAEKVLPKQIVHRKKKGFKSPTEKWFKELLGSKIKEMFADKSNKVFPNYINVNEVTKIVDSHMNGDKNYEKQIFMLLSLYYILESK